MSAGGATRRWHVILIAAVVVGIVAGCAYHVAGVFFERRTAVGFTHATRILQPPPVQRALILVIDGLRDDVARESDRLPIARELASRGASGPSIAEDPTMTGAGVRALGTGTPPAFADIVANKRMPAVTGEHLFSALAAAGHRVAIVGDHTWADLFGDAIAINETRSGVPPLRDHLRPAYEQDNAFVAKALAVLAARSSTVTVVHLSGTDAVSHALGPLSRTYTEKLAALDKQLRALIDACGAECLVVLTSDHGADDRGHHGIGEEIARRTPLILRGPGIRTGAHFIARQADVAPTLAVLLGAAVPGPARGRVLLDALELSRHDAARLALDDAERLTGYARAHAAAFDVTMPDWNLAPARAALAAGDDMHAREAADAISADVLAALRHDDARRAHWIILWVVVLAAAACLVILFAIPQRITQLGSRRVIAIGVLVVIEIAFAAWRTNATWLRRVLVTAHGLPASYLGWFELGAAAVILAAGVGVWRLLRPASDDRLTVLVAFAASAALTDYLLFAAALAAIGALASQLRVRAPALVAAGGLFAIASAIAGPPVWAVLPSPIIVIASWSAIAALAWWRRPPALSRVRTIALAVTLLACAGLQIAGSPWLAARIVVFATLAACLVQRGWHLVWSAAALLLVLSHPAQLPAIVGVLAVVTAAASLPVLQVDDHRRVLVLALLIVGARLLLMRVLEGSLNYSSVEWHVARLGGAPTKLVGHMLVALKLALPIVVLGTLAATVSGRRATHQGLAWALAWLLLAMAHSAASLILSAGQSHTPYVDLSALLFLAILAATVAVGWAASATNSKATPVGGSALLPARG